MLTAEENDLLVPRRGRGPHGPDHAPPLDARLPDRRGQRAGWHAGQRDAARRRPGGVPRHQGPRRRDGRVLPAPPRVAGVRPQRGLRPALPLSRLEDGRGRQRAGDGVRARRQQHGAEGQAPGLPGARGGRLRVGLHGPDRKPCRSSSRPPGRPRPTRKVHDRQGADALQLGADPRRRRSTRRTAPACIPPTWCRRAWKARRPPTPTGCAPRPTRRRACRWSAPATAFVTRRSAGPIKNAATNDYIRSTVFVAPATALIPPNNPYNVANINVPMDDTNTAFYFIAWGHPSTDAGHRQRGANSWASSWAPTWTPTTHRCATAATISGRTARP